MPSCFKRGGELLGRDTVDLVPAVGDEVEDEPHRAELLGEPPHLVVAHAGRVPVERRREVVGQHHVGELGVDRLGELPGLGQIRGSRSPSRGCRRTAPRPATWRSRTECRRALGSSLRVSWRARSPRRSARRARVPSRARRRTTRGRRSAATRRRDSSSALSFTGPEGEHLRHRLPVGLETGLRLPALDQPRLDAVEDGVEPVARRRPSASPAPHATSDASPCARATRQRRRTPRPRARRAGDR